MTRSTTWALALTLTLGLLAAQTASADPASKLFIETPSKLGLAASVARIKAEAKRLGWKIPKIYDMQKTMRKHGHKVRPMLVLSVCKPDLAVKLVGRDDSRMVAAMMPCRVAVYTKADGKTYLSRVNGANLASMMPPRVARVMGAAARGLEQLLAPLAAGR